MQWVCLNIKEGVIFIKWTSLTLLQCTSILLSLFKNLVWKTKVSIFFLMEHSANPSAAPVLGGLWLPCFILGRVRRLRLSLSSCTAVQILMFYVGALSGAVEDKMKNRGLDRRHSHLGEQDCSVFGGQEKKNEMRERWAGRIKGDKIIKARRKEKETDQLRKRDKEVNGCMKILQVWAQHSICSWKSLQRMISCSQNPFRSFCWKFVRLHN